MTKKIFQSICAVALIVMLATLVIIIGVSYEYFNDQFASELERETMLAARGVETGGEEYLKALDGGETRVTWVGADGSVLFDSEADASGMSNHSGREEIAEALEAGSGASVRYSETLSRKTLYCALRLEDGSVVRVSSSQLAVWSLVLYMLQPIVILVLLALGLAVALAFRLSKRITRPLNDINLDCPERAEIYDELRPMLDRVQAQNRQIKSQMKELERRQREFEAVTDGMDEGIIIIDHRADVLSCNESAGRYLGAEEWRKRRNLLSMNSTESLRRVVLEALAGRHGEDALISGDRYYRLLAGPVAGDDGVIGAVVLVMDETEKERREALRREFTANVSHELKTPLTSISGFAELIQNGMAEGEDARRFAKNIYDEAARLITLVGDIIKLSQLDSGEIPFDSERVELYGVAQEVASRLENVAAARGVSIELSGGSVRVPGNRQIIEEMIYNLCDNGVKYGREGGHVNIFVWEKDGRGAVTVADDGIGIPKDRQERVFERFYRVDKSHSRDIGGTGLGLSIVKHGASYHGAKIELESELQKGTSVRIIFPTDKSES